MKLGPTQQIVCGNARSSLCIRLVGDGENHQFQQLRYAFRRSWVGAMLALDCSSGSVGSFELTFKEGVFSSLTCNCVQAPTEGSCSKYNLAAISGYCPQLLEPAGRDAGAMCGTIIPLDPRLTGISLLPVGALSEHSVDPYPQNCDREC